MWSRAAPKGYRTYGRNKSCCCRRDCGNGLLKLVYFVSDVAGQLAKPVCVARRWAVPADTRVLRGICLAPFEQARPHNGA